MPPHTQQAGRLIAAAGVAAAQQQQQRRDPDQRGERAQGP